MNRLAILGSLILAGLFVSLAGSQTAAEKASIPAEGLHNVFRITDKLYSGSSPEGDAGFASLVKLGIKTIISVDGATPELDRAKKFGLRYVHLPIGYDGVPEKQGWMIAKAVRELPGLIYLHCHHGKHRGSAAAAVVHMCLDDKCQVATALEEMRHAGTDPAYVGLYQSPWKVRRPTKQELDALPADFPEVAKVSDLAQRMVKIDEHWDYLKLARAAGWKTPLTHPDIEPAHEALQLREHYREAARLKSVAQRPMAFGKLLTDAEKSAQDLEALLREGKRSGPINTKRAEVAFRNAGAACVQCHARFRDVPASP